MARVYRVEARCAGAGSGLTVATITTRDGRVVRLHGRAARIAEKLAELQADIERYPVGSLRFDFVDRKISALLTRSETIRDA